jgi:hypothetical protein
MTNADTAPIRDLTQGLHPGQKVTLWTVQTSEAWEALQKQRVLRADGRRVTPEFRPAYRWLMAQMKERLPSCSGRYPVWAWYHPKPDLRYAGFLPRGTPGVRIEFVASVDRILLSDFDAWHAVLNSSYLALDETEDEAFDRFLTERGTFHEQLPPNLQDKVRGSWHRIFDLEAMWASGYASLARYIQAVIEEVRLEEVNRVTPFTAR